MKYRLEQNSPNRITYDILSEYRGVLMGLAILSIMMFHYTEDCQAHGLLNGWEYWYYHYIRSSCVDAFLFFSGFGLYFSFKRRPDRKAFYVRRFTKILIPYMLTAVPAFVWMDFFVKGEGVSYFLKDLFFVSFFQEGTTWFWYILLICICYLIFPQVFACFEAAENHVMEHMYMISVFSFFTVICVMLQINQPEFYGNVQIALLRFPVFFFGCLIGKAAYEKRRVSNYVWGFMLLSLLLLPLAKNSKITVVRYVLAGFNLSLCMLFALGMKLVSRWKKPHQAIKAVLEWLGSYSLELYLSHVALRTVMNEYGFYTYQKKYELLMLVLAFAAAILLKKLTDLILKWSGVCFKGGRNPV